MKTTVPVKIPFDVIVPHIESISQQAWTYLGWVGVDATTTMGGHEVDSSTVKAVSGIVCLVTLAGYAWAKGWGWSSHDTQKQNRKEKGGGSFPYHSNGNNETDFVESRGLSTLNDRLWELTVDIDRLRNQVSDMTDNERSDSELNLEFEKFKKEKEKEIYADPHQDEGFNGSNLTQTEYATEDDIPDLELEEDSRFPTRSSSSTQSPVSLTAHILGSVQTREIRGTWVVILAQLQKVGVQCIVDLFELHPFVREHFKEILVHYGKLDPENDNALQNILENHAKLVMNIVHELVVNIDNLDSLGPRLQKLGLFHVKNAVPKRYLDIMGPIFCNAVRPILLKNDVWSSDVEESWMEFFKVLTTVMGKSYDSVENVPTQLSLSPTQKCVIVATWHSIFLKHMNFMGKQLFVDLFKVEPNILKYFDAFRDIGLSNLLQSRSFQNHGVRIMNLVKFAVENLDNPEKLQDHMLVLGRLHVKKGINSKFLDLMGPTFCQAIRPMVMAEGQWSIDIEGAWIQLFKILVQMMKSAYEEKESTGVFPSPNQISLILESWSDIEAGLDEIGVESFKKLFESHSDIQAYFPSMKKISSSDLDMTRKIKEHSGRVMGLVRLYVENIHDIEKITPNIETLGKSHYQRGIKSEYIDVMGPIFCNTIRPLLVRKDLWSLQLEEVWLCLFRKISETMKKGYPREKRKSSKFLKQYKAH